jgi:hypothetical protein
LDTRIVIILAGLVTNLAFVGLKHILLSSDHPARDVPVRPMTCPNCQARFESRDCAVCWNCGAVLTVYSSIREANQTRLETYKEVETRQLEESECFVSIGKCMVCNFDVKDSEEAIWCPRCGAIAHRDHFLEWLHIRHCCPICKEHLNEELLGQPVS